MPGQKGVGLDERGYVLQCLLAELLPDPREALTLSVGQSYAALELVTQTTILRDQVCNAQQECLVD